MNLDYAINILKSEKENCRKYIYTYNEQKKNPRFSNINHNERMNLCIEQIEVLDVAIKILKRSCTKEIK